MVDATKIETPAEGSCGGKCLTDEIVRDMMRDEDERTLEERWIEGWTADDWRRQFRDEGGCACSTLAELEREWEDLDATERDELHAQFEDECLVGTADRLRFYPLLMRQTMDSYVGD